MVQRMTPAGGALPPRAVALASHDLAVQALLVALLQVIPQAGQRAAGVQLGYRVEAGRESSAGGRSPVSILLITSFETQ
jgi:hypothetical protein